MSEPAAIQGAVELLLGPRSLSGERVLVTAGGTREPIDAVRSLTNRSSGKMGFAIAGEAARRGAETILIAAPSALPTPPGVQRVAVRCFLVPKTGEFGFTRHTTGDFALVLDITLIGDHFTWRAKCCSAMSLACL